MIRNAAFVAVDFLFLRVVTPLYSRFKKNSGERAPKKEKEQLYVGALLLTVLCFENIS